MKAKTLSKSNYLEELIKISKALSAEKDHQALLKLIVVSAMKLTNADGGTLYLSQDDKLLFCILINKSLNLNVDSKNNKFFNIEPIPLFNENKQPNLKNIVTCCVNERKAMHIHNAYEESLLDFSGMRLVDQKLNYRSVSFLTFPLLNHEDKTLGVLQLINAMDNDGNVVSFSPEKIILAESVASHAATTLTKQKLIDAQKKLFDDLIILIAKTIDEKSKYTSNHCTRVPVLTMMIAEELNKASPEFATRKLSAEEMEELRIAAWLHDCGKLVTPEYVVDKATKLHQLVDKIDVIELKLEIIKRDLKIAVLESMLNKTIDTTEIENEMDANLQFLSLINKGGEYLTDTQMAKISELAKLTLNIKNKLEPLLTEEDITNLTVERGTLNKKDREVINKHVSVTRSMLEILTYPENLKNVPQIAGDHHEQISGRGYPRGLKGDEVSLQARILAIADIFEALTSADRPYKTAKKLSESLQIMQQMAEVEHIDKKIFALFLVKKIYLDYARKYLFAEQIDVD